MKHKFGTEKKRVQKELSKYFMERIVKTTF
jgi:hypothetical protein